MDEDSFVEISASESGLFKQAGKSYFGRVSYESPSREDLNETLSELSVNLRKIQDSSKRPKTRPYNSQYDEAGVSSAQTVSVGTK